MNEPNHRQSPTPPTPPSRKKRPILGGPAVLTLVGGVALLAIIAVGVVAGIGAWKGQAPPSTDPVQPPPTVPLIVETAGSGEWATLGNLAQWDDGYSEMSYFAATDTIYGHERTFVRVHLTNREWTHPVTGVKVEPADVPNAVPVFKFIAAEQIPTENYHYRYHTTAFLTRPDLAPVKLTFSSQEWCGATFVQARWTDAPHAMVHSYFDGDARVDLPADAVPAEALFLHARAAVAMGTNRHYGTLLPTVRSNKTPLLVPTAADLVVAEKPSRIVVPAGTFVVRRATVRQSASVETADWVFDVEIAPPYRLIAFTVGSVTGQLQASERRAYWDRSSPSAFYPPHRAP